MLYDERYPQDRIAAKVSEIGKQIGTDYPDGDLVLVAVLKGGGLFMADLARHVDRPVRLEYIAVIRGGGTSEDEIIDFHFVTPFRVKNKHLIILKDVIRSGIIENYLMNQLREEGPASIRLACLVDRPQERKSSLVVDYVCFPSEEGILVGYGMEFEGLGGNLPFIAQVRVPEAPSPQEHAPQG
jgi:hypoxanthine phosphoribosyltransferase